MNKSLLDLYTDYLISSFGPTTATGLSRLLEGEISHDQVTRFLAAPAKRSAHLWHLVKPMVRQVESDDGLLLLDDSIEEKPYTDENELICWHWDHSKQRYVKGINFLTAFYQTEKVGLPVAFDLVTKTETYVDPKTGKQKRRSTITKNARYRMLLHICIHNQVRFRYVLNDARVSLGRQYEVRQAHSKERVHHAAQGESQGRRESGKQTTRSVRGS